MRKCLTVLLILSGFAAAQAQAASVKIAVEVNGASKTGTVYFDLTQNSNGDIEYAHLDRLRVRVGGQGYNIAARSNIDDHVCQLLGYEYADYRTIGNGGYEEADSNIVREDGRNMIVPINFDRREISKHFPIANMTCARSLR